MPQALRLRSVHRLFSTCDQKELGFKTPPLYGAYNPSNYSFWLLPPSLKSLFILALSILELLATLMLLYQRSHPTEEPDFFLASRKH